MGEVIEFDITKHYSFDLPFIVEADEGGGSMIVFENGRYYEINRMSNEKAPFYRREVTRDQVIEMIKDAISTPYEERFPRRKKRV